MARPYSNDLRIRIVKSIESGMTQKEAALKHDVHENTVRSIYKKYKETGSVDPKKPVGVGRPCKIDIEKLNEIYTEDPDTYQYEAAAILSVAQSAVSYRLKKLGIAQKKRA